MNFSTSTDDIKLLKKIFSSLFFSKEIFKLFSFYLFAFPLFVSAVSRVYFFYLRFCSLHTKVISSLMLDTSCVTFGASLLLEGVSGIESRQPNRPTNPAIQWNSNKEKIMRRKAEQTKNKGLTCQKEFKKLFLNYSREYKEIRGTTRQQKSSAILPRNRRKRGKILQGSSSRLGASRVGNGKQARVNETHTLLAADASFLNAPSGRINIPDPRVESNPQEDIKNSISIISRLPRF